MNKKRFMIQPGHPWNIVESDQGLAASAFFFGRDNDPRGRPAHIVTARAALITDALNVHHDTGLSPSQLLELLRAVLPYAESRLEDMNENVESCTDDATRAEAQEHADKARQAIDAAMKAVGT